MSQKLNLAIGFQSHLPVYSSSNGDNEILNKHLDSVYSLINSILHLNNVKVNFYLSENLLKQLDRKYVDFASMVSNLLTENKLELLSGGKYDPLFPLIPKEDRQIQIKLMNRYLNHVFGYTPTGAWISESAWDTSLALDLAKARMNYTCLPSDYFISAGVKKKDICDYFVTEDDGRKVAVFPISFELNNYIEIVPPKEAINQIRNEITNLGDEEHSYVVFYNDLISSDEKKKWLVKFLEELENKNENVETNLLNELFANKKSKGRIYFPAITTTTQTGFSKSWKYILVKYPEANLIHKKMLRVSKKIHSAKEGKSKFKVIKEMINQAHDLLLRGQSNNIYWDHNYCGIYSPSGRTTTYSDLIKAENLIDKALKHGENWMQVSETDYDCDGNDEILVEGELQNIYISPFLGGAIVEHDFRPKNVNLINTMSRKREDYHDSEQNDSNGKKAKLFYDNYLKFNLIDHFLSEITLEGCVENQFKQLTKKIIYPYNIEMVKAKEQTCRVWLCRDVSLDKYEGNPVVYIDKSIGIKAGDSGTDLNYVLNNKSDQEIKFIFATEFNFNLLTKDEKNSLICLNGNPSLKSLNPSLLAKESHENIKQFSILNKEVGVNLNLSWDKPAKIFRYPIETLSYENHELKSLYQGTTIIVSWELSLKPKEQYEINLLQNLSSNI